MMALDKHPRTRAWLAPAAMLGRVSLATFIAQYYVYFTLLKLWDPPYSPWWPLMFAVSLVVVFGISALWSRFGSNDVFGVGYRWLVTTTAGARPAAAAP
jgi:hypothetical protein